MDMTVFLIRVYVYLVLFRVILSNPDSHPLICVDAVVVVKNFN